MKSLAVLGTLALLVGSGAGDSLPVVSSIAASRLDLARLRAVHEAREQFSRERRSLPEMGAMQDYRAVIAVHAEDVDHNLGLRDVVLAAKKAGVNVVLFTDYGRPRPERWRGLQEGVLFLAGSKDLDAGVIRFPNFDGDGTALPAHELRFLSRLEEQPNAATRDLAGIEICNRRSNLLTHPATLRVLAGMANEPAEWARLVESYRAFPDEFYAAGSHSQPELLARWDAETEKRRFTGIGANDAHQDVVIKGVTFDPYELSFRHSSTHLFARELSEPAVREALREGHAYVAHDWLCDPTGFAFGAVNNLGLFPMGDRAPMQGTTRVMALTPLAARLKLFHRGVQVAENHGTNLTYTAREPGPYRVEAWLEVAGEERPWIYSNPVYLETMSLFAMRWPNTAEAPNVDVTKDISYVDGETADDAKHRLDVYQPRGARQAPVFFFVHGGAWRFGDRALYPPLGHRIAKEGVVTVIPSYRLAPKHPHPAQIEDVAAALAWTMRHIAEYGGDTNRVFVAGHSAGGHLVSLLSLDQRHLARHGLEPSHIRGVIALSGAYDLTAFEGQSSVFGDDPDVRRDASPQSFVRVGRPPFFVSYCEWDYPTLPWQAKRFHRALVEAGLEAELFFVPRDNHIYEMINMTHDDDPTTEAVLRFLRRVAP